HRHMHMHPTVAGLVARIGRQRGARSGRVPNESARLLGELERSNARMLLAPLLGPWLGILRWRLAPPRMRVNARVFGLAWSGAMTEARWLALLPRLPEGVNEIYCHPAVTDAIPGATPGYRYAEEFAALVSPRVKAAIREHGIELTSFSALEQIP